MQFLKIENIIKAVKVAVDIVEHLSNIGKARKSYSCKRWASEKQGTNCQVSE